MRAYLEQVWGETAARFRVAAENTDNTNAATATASTNDPIDDKERTA